MVSWLGEAGAVLDPTRAASDSTESALRGAYDDAALFADTTAGQADELVGKQFDDDKTTLGFAGAPLDAGADLLFNREGVDPTGDSIDLPGPGAFEASEDAADAAASNPAITAALVGVVILAASYLLGQLFTFNVGDSDA